MAGAGLRRQLYVLPHCRSVRFCWFVLFCFVCLFVCLFDLNHFNTGEPWGGTAFSECEGSDVDAPPYNWINEGGGGGGGGGRFTIADVFL